MTRLAIAALALLTACQTSPTERAQASAMLLNRAYAELDAVQSTLDHLDLRHWVYAIHGTCMDPDWSLLRQLESETRNMLDETCERLLEEVPEVHLVRQR